MDLPALGVRANAQPQGDTAALEPFLCLSGNEIQCWGRSSTLYYTKKNCRLKEPTHSFLLFPAISVVFFPTNCREKVKMLHFCHLK